MGKNHTNPVYRKCVSPKKSKFVIKIIIYIQWYCKLDPVLMVMIIGKQITSTLRDLKLIMWGNAVCKQSS